MIPRLAGWALRGLTGAGSKGAMKIGGRTLGSMAREAGTDAALIYGASQVPNVVGAGLNAADGSMTSDRIEDLVKEGTQGGDYKIGLGDKFGNVVSGAFGAVGIGDGAQVTQESVKARAQSNLEDTYKPMLAQYGAVGTKGASEGQLKNELLKAKELYDKGVTERSLGYQSGQEEKEYNRGRLELQYNDNQTKEKVARQDRLASEQNSLNQALAELDFKKGQANRQYDYDNRMLDYKMKERKADRMQKIAMALGGLGQLFAT